MLSYDRRASDELMAALSPNGFAHSLVEFANAGLYPLDLQVRGYAGKPGTWVTLYVGLTKVLDLHNRGDRFKLNAHTTYQAGKHGWNSSWGRWQSAASLGSKWQDVETYLDTVIPSVGASHLKEGAVQSAVSALKSRDLVAIDREVVIAFSSKAERTQVGKKLWSPMLQVLVGASTEAWWKALPTSLGGECDALAISAEGDLLAIEIKPASAAIKGIAWAPLQARHYAALIQQWADETPTAGAILQGVVAQRQTLGLLNGATTIREPIRVQPVLVLQSGAAVKAKDRMWQVEHLLRKERPQSLPVRILELTPAGRLKDCSLPTA